VIEREFPDGSRIVSSIDPEGKKQLFLELVDGQRVSRVVIVPTLMRLGATVVRMDGIGGVKTDEAFRNRGYSRLVMETAIELMRAGDAALSTLFGIADFYPKFGYATTGAEWTVTLPLREISTSTASLPAGWSVRDFRPDDLPAVMRLYHRNTHHATCALMRHIESDESEGNTLLAEASPLARQIGRRSWKKLENIIVEPEKDDCWVVLDPSGVIAAYVWLGQAHWSMRVRRESEPNAFHLAEVMANGPLAADAMLATCRQWATDMGNDPEEIQMAIPPEGPVANAAAHQGGTFVGRHSRDGNFMGRVLDVGRLLVQMRPELSARIRACRTVFEGDLVFVTDAGDATLAIGPEGVSTEAGSGAVRVVVEMPQVMLARLCLGTFEPSDILARLPRSPDQRSRSLLTALFPRRLPHIYPLDHF
jgi:hypothetical protein